MTLTVDKCWLFLPIHFTMAGNFLSNTNTRFKMVCTICSSQCLCMPSFLHWPIPPFLYPFTQPLPAPVLGARPGFRQGSVCSQPWQPATLLFLSSCPTILETSQLFALIPYNPSPTRPVPERPADATRSRQKHPEAAQATSLKER